RADRDVDGAAGGGQAAPGSAVGTGEPHLEHHGVLRSSRGEHFDVKIRRRAKQRRVVGAHGVEALVVLGPGGIVVEARATEHAHQAIEVVQVLKANVLEDGGESAGSEVRGNGVGRHGVLLSALNVPFALAHPRSTPSDKLMRAIPIALPPSAGSTASTRAY